MTAYLPRLKGKTPNSSNKKDGGNTRRRNACMDRQFEALGFEMADWNKWTYRHGDGLVIKLVPGTVDFELGWVAIYEDRQIPIGKATPAQIKARLDDEIENIIRWQAEAIGPEIDF